MGYYFDIVAAQAASGSCNIEFCTQCPPCDDPDEVRVECKNSYDPNRGLLTGQCKSKALLVPTAVCPVQDTIVDLGNVLKKSDWVSQFGLGGFSFQEVFGQTPSAADFQCRRVCDGTAALTTADAGTIYGQIDTGQCDGP